jgi:hypothetical protein
MTGPGAGRAGQYMVSHLPGDFSQFGDGCFGGHGIFLLYVGILY